MGRRGWTDERVERLGRLWRDGLSASQVAAALGGVSRNAVIGKLWRLGLMGIRPPPPPRPRRVKPQKAARPPRRPRAAGPRAAALAAIVDLPGLVPRLEDLRRGACRWPIGDPKAADFAFCGREAKGPYCQAHGLVAYRPGAEDAAEAA